MGHDLLEPKLSQLLSLLFEGSFETPPWNGFLQQLRLLTGASYASLIFRPVNMPLNALIEHFSGERSPPNLQVAYTEEIHLRDPLPHYRMIDGSIYSLEEMLDLNDPEHFAYYKDLLEPSGMSEMRIMRVVESSGLSGWLTIARPAPAFEDKDDAILEFLAPHLRSTLRSFAALERSKAQLDIAGQVSRRLNYGWITLDASGRVVDMDRQAEDLLKSSRVLTRKDDGRLIASSAKVGREITESIKAFTAKSTLPPRAIRLSDEPWMDMLMVPVDHRIISPQAPPVAIAYVHSDGWSNADRCQQLGELFKLTHSEAKLALAISRGATIAEAASELGLTIETARNYTKRIYAKTGARGQSDLIRYVLASVLALA